MIPTENKTTSTLPTGGNQGCRSWFVRWIGRIWSFFSWPLVALINRIRGVAQPILNKPADPVIPTPDKPVLPAPLPTPPTPPTLPTPPTPTPEEPTKPNNEVDIDLSLLFGSDSDIDFLPDTPAAPPPPVDINPQPPKPDTAPVLSKRAQLRQKRLQDRLNSPVKPTPPPKPKPKLTPKLRPPSPKPIDTDVIPWNPTEPLKLRNIGLSCYMDSVLQALLCVDTIVNELRKPLEKGDNHKEDFKKITAIHQELLKFISSNPINMKDTLIRLRKAIFDSGFHGELKTGIDQQKDAAPVIELIQKQLFPHHGLFVKEYCRTKEFPGLTFNYFDTMPTLQISFQQKKAHLLNLIHLHFSSRKGENVREFDPKRAIAPQNGDPKKTQDFTQSYRLMNLPPVMMLHFKRYEGTVAPIKMEDDVILPKDGIVDFANYCDEKSPLHTKYKIKSYVEHIGDKLTGGHYVTYLEKNGKYFLCNDLDQNCYKEISKEEFFNNKKAYLVVLEQIKD